MCPFDVVGVGQNSVDEVVLLPRMPAASAGLSKLRILRRDICCGGQTATAMAACARLGLRARYVGPVGADENGTRILEALAAEGVDSVGTVRMPYPNGTALVLVDATTGERIVLWQRDQRLALGENDIGADLLSGAAIVHVDDGDTATAIHTALLARDAGIPVTSDIDKTLDATEELISLVTYPIMAEHVPSALTGEGDLEAALTRMRRRFDQVLTVTLGSRGAVALDGERLIGQPAFAVDAVDTTGAGDVFRAGFIYALLAGKEIAEVLRFACAAAAASCRRVGAMAGAPRLAEVLELLP
ncbi:MAG: carbohydrate kinase family protein [Vicinamibacterales bacterium]